MYIKNSRPISLPNVDVKIASKVVATRLETVLPLTIHDIQCPYVKGPLKAVQSIIICIMSYNLYYRRLIAY